jgi:nitrile hydratase
MSPARRPRFSVGESVRVRRIYEPDLHHRIPRYVRGVVGTIEAICGEAHLAAHGSNEMEPFFTVRFSSLDVWGERSDEAPFVIHVDLWQSYLEGTAAA